MGGSALAVVWASAVLPAALNTASLPSYILQPVHPRATKLTCIIVSVIFCVLCRVTLCHLLQTLGYDYCNNKFRHPEPNSCAAVLQEFDQCGGKSKCSDFGCEDEPWPGACCPQGTRCYRQDSFYYQCLSPYNVQRLKEQQAAAAAAGIAFAGLKPDTTAPLQQLPDQAGLLSQDLLPEEQQQAVVEEEQEEILTQEDPASLLPSPDQDASQSPNSAETQTQTQTQVADSADSLIPSPGQAGSSDSWRNSDGLTAPITLSPARQPTKVYTKLKIDMDYDKLVSSPENTARFKSDVVTWLKSSVGNTQNVQDAGGSHMH